MGAVHDISMQLPPTVHAPSVARRAIDQLPLQDYREARFNLRLLVSELVTNSVRHAGLADDEQITLEVAIHPGLVRVVVTDNGIGFGEPAFEDEPPTGTSGRGLFLVDALADRWGQNGDAARTVVWFELDLA